jgi:hypothetical protein
MSVFKQFFDSKKFLAALSAALVILFSDGLGLTADQAEDIVKVIMLYIGAQGVADIGKEKIKIESQLHRWSTQK